MVFGWRMCRGNLHTNTNFSPDDGPDLFILSMKQVPKVLARSEQSGKGNSLENTIETLSRTVKVYLSLMSLVY